MKNIILSILLVGFVCALQAADKKDAQPKEVPACCAKAKVSDAKACPADKQAKAACCPADKQGCKDAAAKQPVVSPKAAGSK